MKVALDISPLASEDQVRGIGFYTQRLRDKLTLLASREGFFQLREFSGELKEKVDIIHYPYFHPFFRTLPLFKGAKTIVTIHDLIPLKFPTHFPCGFKGKLNWWWQRFALFNVSAIITDSYVSKRDIVGLTGTPEVKIQVVYLAADECFRPIKNRRYLEKLRRRYQLPNKFVLYVGDLNWNKNVPMLTRTCLECSYPLVVVGKQGLVMDFDNNHPENRDLVLFHKLASQYPDKIIRLGFIPTEDLVGIYNLASFCVQSSLAEGFGLPVLEAMQSGCPVITSQVTSLAEISGEAAWLINPYKQKELKRALVTLWQKSGIRRRLVSLGLRQAQRFSWEKTAQETLTVYQKVFKS